MEKKSYILKEKSHELTNHPTTNQLITNQLITKLTNHQSFDIAIVGGGLSGLCLAIQLQTAGLSVVLFEQHTYPFHKVCGEYISMESWDFLLRLGVPLHDWGLPIIDKLVVTAPSGFALNQPLPLGGFGVSRFKLDKALADIAKEKKVFLQDNCKVRTIETSNGYQLHTTKGVFNAKQVFGTYGRYTPNFMNANEKHAMPYIGIKRHIKIDLPADTIFLHNFKDGYCGISQIEDQKFCLCYLTTAQNLKQHGNSIEQMERNVLMQNPFLQHIFETAKQLYPKPLSISNISFKAKTTALNSLFLAGDAAGSIAPLCGNGMSMAMHASKMLAEQTILHHNHQVSDAQLADNYAKNWHNTFHHRIQAGYYLQKMFGNVYLTEGMLRFLNISPSLTQFLIKQTYGKPF